jgi:hypothetical protein
MYAGKAYLQAKLNTVSDKIQTKYDYYERKNTVNNLSIAIPAQLMERYKTKLGWCAKAVDLLADRLAVNRFKNDNFNIEQIYMDNNSDILFGSAIKGALISSCDFIYIYPANEGIMKDSVRMQVVGGKNATGILDDTTQLLSEGYAVLKRNPKNNSDILLDAYFTPEYTQYTDYENKREWQVPNNTGYCMLVPIINNPKEGTKSFGHSRIAREMMNCQDGAEKLMTEIKILAEVNSWPQKWITGLAEGTEVDSLRATFASLLRFDKDEDGDRPTVGQFTQMSFGDHVKMFDTMVSTFAGMSSLTRDDLGFVTENPSSAESKKAALEALRVTAGRCQRDFSTGFLNAGLVAASLRDNTQYSRQLLKDTKILWKPLVEPDAATLSSIGDGIIKINQAVPDFFTVENISDLLGIDASVIGANTNGLFDFEATNP